MSDMRDEPGRLFDFDDSGGGECRFPMVMPTSGYRYGCRCPRCVHAKRAKAPSTTCHVDGCGNVRVKQRKVCVDHLPRCRFPGCDNPKRLVQAAKYCEEHATCVDGAITGNRFASREVECYLCGAPCMTHAQRSWYLCSEHQHLGMVAKQWRRHHNMNAVLAQKLFAEASCWICGGDLSWRFHHFCRKDDTIQVDHDHRCCNRQTSCGNCIRGLAHPACNRELGHVEKLIARSGPERVRRLLDLLCTTPPDGE